VYKRQGLTKLGDWDNGQDISPDYKNSVIQIGISYTLFTPKKK
jgi:hypothetical protein